MRKVTFTKDFANKKKGDSMECDGYLSSHLVRVAKVAKYESAPVNEKTGYNKNKGSLKKGKN